MDPSVSKRVLPIKLRRFLWVFLDTVLLAISMLLALVFYFDVRPPEAHIIHALRTVPILAIATVISLNISGLYRSLIRFASVDTFLQIMFSSLAGTGVTYVISLTFYLTRGDGPNIFLMPRPVYLMQWLIAVFLIAWSRFIVHINHHAALNRNSLVNRILKHRRDEIRIGLKNDEDRHFIIIGAGYAGATVVRDIQSGRYGNAVATVIIDTDKSKNKSFINRVPVMNLDITTAIERYPADEIIITVKNVSQRLINECIDTGLKVRLYSEAQGVIRELNIADLLGRPEQHIDLTEAREYFLGKRVLVTGGGGSIGSELCRQILSFTPSKIIIYDISENYMYDLLFELREKYGELVSNTVVLEVGSVRDEESLWRVMGKYKPDIVIHAAAHKHVPLMENSPEQAILNNVFGTYKTAKVAVECGVKRFVLISTDKAVNPTNVMGASKRMAEMIVNSMNGGKTQFVAVRFGNVLGSHGSVVPIFEKQIKAGGPVTITSPDIIRYFMTIPEASSLVLQAAAMAHGGELYVLDMGEPVKIKNLAERMIKLYGKGTEKIEYVGLRPGEKMYEELLLDKETDKATEKDRIYITEQETLSSQEIEEKLKRLENAIEQHKDVKIAVKEIVETYHVEE